MFEELVQYIAFCCAVKRNKEATVVRKLVAVKFYHEENGVFHELYCLRRGDVAFPGGAAAGKRERKEADKVEIRFKGSKGDQEIK